MKKHLLLFVLLGMALGFTVSCATPQAEGLIQLGGWQLPAGRVKGYNIYIAEAGAKKYEKANDDPIVGKTIAIEQLKAGKAYYLYMTQVSNDDPPRESRPGKTFQKVAQAKKAAEE